MLTAPVETGAWKSLANLLLFFCVLRGSLAEKGLGLLRW